MLIDHTFSRVWWKCHESVTKVSWKCHECVRERRNHHFKYESDYLTSHRNMYKHMNRGRFGEKLLPLSFCHPRCNPTEKFFSRKSFQSRCVSHISIHQNVRIALQFSFSLQFSYLNMNQTISHLTGICIKIWIVEGSARNCYLWVFVIHAAIQPKNSFPEKVFNPAVSLIWKLQMST